MLVTKVPNGRWIHIIPTTILVYIVAYMDRTNIAFAIAGGMDKDLGMTSTIAGLAAGIFFIGYMVLQVPGGMIAEKGSAKRFIAWSILAWGGLAVISGFVQSPTQLLMIRFLLGVAEGGIWPAILVIISNWFPNEERGRANAFFIMNIAIASIITGPLSGWILTFSNWRMVFIIEGIISLALIVIWLPFIYDKPEDAKWISKEELDYLLRKRREEQEKIKEIQTNTSFIGILKKANTWKLIFIYFFYQTGIYGFSLWLPTIIKELTHTGMGNVGLLSIFPYIGTIVGLYLFAQLSDRSMNRKLYTALPMICFAICLFFSVEFTSHIWISFAFLIGCGVFLQSASSIFWTIPPLLFSPEVAGRTRGLINALGNLGGFLGPYIVGWLTANYSQNIGIYGLICFLIVGFILTMLLPNITSGKSLSTVNGKGLHHHR
ncbi:MFS transporter [Bacillus ginsengihumi]|uniref:MFS transporter n=1 Tax=Heyndrickxia ginsengihumi TaxID=363870 RepID=A0A6M0PC25_9BACI|nr:MFS transporter [Heyndrickxia ginsengihumi]MBE6183327.1 MFS transporter [Bacillus sp. (in: firmicutes)]NEY21048.1 MFS transporter [Heyndrickxia ginsengihumi]